MTSREVIITEGLTRRFGNIVAVDRLTLDVRAGEVFGFLGHNGAGKTTTVRLLNGVLEPSAGSAQVLGMDPVTEGHRLRRLTGVLTETPSVDARLTARENLTLFADMYGVPKAHVRRRTAELLEAFGLAERADDKVGGFSRGMRQRLALARALLHEPEMLFLDEPTSGLDPVAARDVRDLILRLSQEEGRTVFLCTHNLVEAQQLCDRVAIMRHGALLALGTPRELAQQMSSSSRLDVEVPAEDEPAALAILRGLPLVTELVSAPARPAHRENGAVITATGIFREAIPDALAALVEAGVRVYRAGPQELSLEDAYFALHEKKEG